MRTTDYGKKVGQALKAVAQMHFQVGQLLSDCDKLFPDYESVFGAIATRDLTRSVNAPFWMAEGVYRYWFRESPSVIGVTALFHQREGGKLEEPLFVVGQIDYDSNGQEAKDQCDPWDLWEAVMGWAPQPLRMGEAINLRNPEKGGRIQNMKFIVVPLFQIESLDDVRTLFRKIGVELPR